MDFSILERKIGYVFQDKRLLERAFTLAAVSDDNNEKLECFGDAILEFIVTEKLYPICKDEREMTVRRKGIVSDKALTRLSKQLDLDEFLIKSKGDNNNKKAVPSAYESLTAAIYLDGGMQAAKAFVYRTMDFNARYVGESDPKSRLQELLQARGLSAPVYGRKELGSPQNPRFQAWVTVYGKTYTGQGANAKTAEKAAASAALKDIR